MPNPYAQGYQRPAAENPVVNAAAVVAAIIGCLLLGWALGGAA